MSAHDPTDDEGASEFDRSIDEGDSIRERLPTAIGRRARNGTLALVAGGLMLGRAARAITTSRSRALLRGVAGAGLVVLGLRQRRSAAGTEHRYSTGVETTRERSEPADVTINGPSSDASGTTDVQNETESTDEGTAAGRSEDVEMEDEPEDVGMGEETGSSEKGEETGSSEKGEETGSSETGERTGDSETGEEADSSEMGEEADSSETAEETGDR